ncbi:hypothetical protein [Ruminococcus sp.]|uniref:hypothetical protein n=1 Tax=Ruminococcus sp. TaxID=41978 RepID=UPI003995ED4B
MKEITGTVSERVVRLGGAAETEEIKIIAAEMQMCASLAAGFIGCWDGVFLLERNHRNCFRKSRQTGQNSRNRRNKNHSSRNADVCKLGCRVHWLLGWGIFT